MTPAGQENLKQAIDPLEADRSNKAIHPLLGVDAKEAPMKSNPPEDFSIYLNETTDYLFAWRQP